ncbi:hypothetical protein [Alkaliphilus hydrothermalis]|uniref:Uncharacterized protein n=1 Tax=Alkaliphilus hydrothermalis TaxID=1482730 RepID=A0ABS2NTR0_9FIRM|nr:hypothetical protein [Alkaliphilus hydrothermalis]MBM7616350.1 hypothetical protein [Alkaliphilus hydrothermalis]
MRLRILVLTLLMVLVLSVLANASTSIPSGLDESATEGSEKFKSMNVNEYKNFGYDNSEQMLSASLGEGFRIYIIDYEKLEGNKKDKFIDVIVPTNQWQFIVETNGKPASFLRVEESEGKFEAILFGGDARYFSGAINRFKNEKKSAPILIMDGNKFYILYQGPNNQELIMNIPSPSEVNRGIIDQFTDATAFLENLKKQQHNYKLNGSGEQLYGNGGLDITLQPQPIEEDKGFNKLYLLLGLLIASVVILKIKD